jgi:hypothetical protein
MTGFTAGFAGPAFAGGFGGAALPPLMARSIGMSLLAFAGMVFPATFADLLVLGISTSLTFDPDPAQIYIVIRTRDIVRRAAFRLLFQSVNAANQACGPMFVTAPSATGVLLSTAPYRV